MNGKYSQDLLEQALKQFFITLLKKQRDGRATPK